MLLISISVLLVVVGFYSQYREGMDESIGMPPTKFFDKVSIVCLGFAPSFVMRHFYPEWGLGKFVGFGLIAFILSNLLLFAIGGAILQHIGFEIGLQRLGKTRGGMQN